MSKQLMLGYLSVLVDVEIGFDTELPIDLNAIAEGMEDYGVYAHGFDVDFDVEELSDSDGVAHEDENASQESTLKNSSNRERQDIYEALLARSNLGK
jgi:hypothetical protein